MAFQHFAAKHGHFFNINMLFPEKFVVCSVTLHKKSLNCVL